MAGLLQVCNIWWCQLRLRSATTMRKVGWMSIIQDWSNNQGITVQDKMMYFFFGISPQNRTNRTCI